MKVAGRTPPSWTYVALHTVLAGALMAAFQRLALAQSVETSALWAVCFAAGAAHLAWKQTTR